MCFQRLDQMISKSRYQIAHAKSGNTKVVPRKRFIDMVMWIPNNGLDDV